LWLTFVQGAFVSIPRLSIRARILLAVLERLPEDAADESILYEVAQCPSGQWGALVIWKVPARVGSLTVLGRQGAYGATKEAAERKLLGELWALPAMEAA
jgi:hypothetical protein